MGESIQKKCNISVRATTLTENQQHKYDIRKHNGNNPIVKHISDQNHPVNINNATTVKIMSNV